MGHSDRATRIKKFSREFYANDTLIACMDKVVGKYNGKIKLRGDTAHKDLDLLISAMFGKAEKTYKAVSELCSLGFGEDALVLLRSNINLMINLYYIIAKDSVERASACIAYGHREQAKYLKTGKRGMPRWMSRINWHEIDRIAARWKKVNIEARGQRSKTTLPLQCWIPVLFKLRTL